MRLYEILVDCAEKKLAQIMKEGSARPGHNGPYLDMETPLRNTLHYSILLLKAHEITGKNKFLSAAKKCYQYAFRKENRPFGYTFIMRNNTKKNRVNGLIGPAWAIESLMHGYMSINEREYLSLSKEIFLMHEFNHKKGLFRICEIDGKKGSFDFTINHQIWFAMSGSMIEDSIVQKRVLRFMDLLDKNIRIHKNGLIRHLAYADSLTVPYLLKNLIQNKDPKSISYLRDKESGYHAFNCYALAVLKKRYPRHSFWMGKKFNMILSYAASEEHIRKASSNKYGYPYNPSGIETAYLFQETGFYHDRIPSLLESQFLQHLDKNNEMTRNTGDPETLSARIYEACRLDDYDLTIP